jgi:hypothetical protein
VVVNPHSSALGPSRYEQGALAFLENLQRWCAGRPLLHEVTVTDR